MPGDTRDLVGNILTGMAGTTQPTQAGGLGFPEAAGMTPEQLKILLSMPEQQARVEGLREDIKTEPVKRKLLEAKAGAASRKSIDSRNTFLDYLKVDLPQVNAGIKDIDNRWKGDALLLTGFNPEMMESYKEDMIHKSSLIERRDQLMKKSGEAIGLPRKAADTDKQKSATVSDIIKVRSSKGKIIPIKRADLEKAKKLDPGMKIVK